MEKIKTKKFELLPVHGCKEKKRSEINMLEDQGAWNRKIENQARESFKETEELREQVETIKNLGKTRQGLEDGLKATVKRLMNIPVHERTAQEEQTYINLPKDLQKLIDEKHRRRYGF